MRFLWHKEPRNPCFKRCLSHALFLRFLWKILLLWLESCLVWLCYSCFILEKWVCSFLIQFFFFTDRGITTQIVSHGLVALVFRQKTRLTQEKQKIFDWHGSCILAFPMKVSLVSDHSFSTEGLWRTRKNQQERVIAGRVPRKPYGVATQYIFAFQ